MPEMNHRTKFINLMKHCCKIFLLLSFLSISSIGFSQKYLIEGTIRDSETREPIPLAGIILKNSDRGTTSGDQGTFKFELTAFPAVLFIQCMGYVRDTVVIDSESLFISGFKNQSRVFLLTKSTVQINEVQVKARSILFEEDPYAIIDFKIVGKQIVALGYKNGNEFRKEVLLSGLSGNMSSSSLFKKLDSIYQDCQGNVFAFCPDSAFELRPSRKQISILNRYAGSFISDFIVPVCGLSDSLIFLKKSSFNHQYDNYFAVNDSQKALLIYSTGGLMKDRQAASIKNTWTEQGQLMITLIPPVGCSGGCLSGWLASVYEPAYHRYFGSHFNLVTGFHPVFTKMIPFDKHYLIFDREAATIFWLDKGGETIREVGMNNRLNGIHFQDVHLDSGTGRIYLEFPQGTFTHFIEINPETGQEIRRFMVRDFRHIEKCVFLNDRLYFLYQPDIGKRIKKVYSINIL